LTEAFSAMWPNAPHRVLRRSVEAAAALDTDLAGSISTPAGEFDVPRGAVISPTRETRGSVGAMALYAGESVASVDRVESASAIIVDLVGRATALLSAARAGEAK